jgi:tRNA(adenine34) deaminase
MEEALALGRRAALQGEVPVGALVVLDGAVIGRGHNRPIGACDPTAHAEILALREAARAAGNYRLTGATLVVTLEPCLMCFGAAFQARLGRVVFGASDPKLGASELAAELQSRPGALNHRIAIAGGVRAAESARMLQQFFAEKRGPAAQDRSLTGRPAVPGPDVSVRDGEPVE